MVRNLSNVCFAISFILKNQSNVCFVDFVELIQFPTKSSKANPLFVTDATLLSRRVPNEGTRSIARESVSYI